MAMWAAAAAIAAEAGGYSKHNFMHLYNFCIDERIADIWIVTRLQAVGSKKKPRMQVRGQDQPGRWQRMSELDAHGCPLRALETELGRAAARGSFARRDALAQAILRTLVSRARSCGRAFVRNPSARRDTPHCAGHCSRPRRAPAAGTR